MNPFEADECSCWNGLGDYTSFIDFDAPDLYWTSPAPSASVTPGMSLTSNVSAEKGLKRGREQKKSPQSESKACRDKLRREKMNDKFSELSLFLHPERPAKKADKSVILGDAICALDRLQSELQELKEKKGKLQDCIQNLKSEKNELKEEKLQLRARKESMELKMKSIAGFVQVQPAMYRGGGNKVMAFSGYGGLPMWQWISPAVLDISQDHVLRSPVA